MLSEWMKASVSVEPYSRLAEIYDHVMRHVNYRDWAAHLRRLFSYADIAVNDVLDISCGTGSLMLELRGLGYHVAGFDASHAMVRIAQRKFKTKQARGRIWCGRMECVAVSKRFDAVVSTYDSVNYCLRADALRLAFEQVASVLRQGGVFVFDISTTRNSRQYFQNYYDRDKTEAFEYVRQSYYLSQSQRQVNEFYVRRLADGKTFFYEKHQQRIYTIDEIENIIPSESFNLIGVYDGFSLQPGSEESDRVHFMLKRNG